MQRREHQVTGKRSLYRDVSRFQIADFADHDDVWILTQNRTQPTREGHLDFGIHLGLPDAVNVILDRIFHRHDVACVVVDALQRRVQGRSFTGTGWTRDEQNAVRFMDQLVHQGLTAWIHAERVELQAAGLFI